jgi:hypothetical protein
MRSPNRSVRWSRTGRTRCAALADHTVRTFRSATYGIFALACSLGKCPHAPSGVRRDAMGSAPYATSSTPSLPLQQRAAVPFGICTVPFGHGVTLLRQGAPYPDTCAAPCTHCATLLRRATTRSANRAQRRARFAPSSPAPASPPHRVAIRRAPPARSVVHPAQRSGAGALSSMSVAEALATPPHASRSSTRRPRHHARRFLQGAPSRRPRAVSLPISAGRFPIAAPPPEAIAGALRWGARRLETAARPRRDGDRSSRRHAAPPAGVSQWIVSAAHPLAPVAQHLATTARSSSSAAHSLREGVRRSIPPSWPPPARSVGVPGVSHFRWRPPL